MAAVKLSENLQNIETADLIVIPITAENKRNVIANNLLAWYVMN